MKRLSFRLVSPHELRRALSGHSADSMWNPEKKDFISTATHQLRSPLTGMKWTLNMLIEDEDSRRLTDAQKKWLQAAHESNERVINMIDDMLNALRVESGAVPFVPVDVDIEQLMTSLVSELMSAANEKHLEITIDVDDRTPTLYLDEEKMRVAVQNLIHNAVKYTPEHGHVTITVTPDHEENIVVITIADSGIGIPDAEQKDIFRRFFRGSNAMQVDRKGTGLGLYITKNVVERHGGKIWFETEVDKGTTFCITLPFAGLQE